MGSSTATCDSPDEWFARIKGTRGVNFAEVSWVERFASIAPRTATFWASAAQALHGLGRHSDAYDAWQRAIDMECWGDMVDRSEMAQAFFRRVADEGDYDHYFADKALALYAETGNWQMVAYINARRRLVKPMLEAFAQAYRHGKDWSQPDLEAPYGIEDWWELVAACSGEHELLWSAFGRGYCHGISLPEFQPPADSE